VSNVFPETFCFPLSFDTGNIRLGFGYIYGSARLGQATMDETVKYSIVDIDHGVPGAQFFYLPILEIGIRLGFNVIHWVILLVCSGHSFSGGNGEICGWGATLGSGTTFGFTTGLTIVGMVCLLF
jgi:hypothetical protein